LYQSDYSDSDEDPDRYDDGLTLHQPVFYSFGKLSLEGSRDSDLGGGGLSDSESTAGPGNDLEAPAGSPDEGSMPGDKNHGAAAYHVLESRYIGDGYLRGHHSATLTAILSERATVSQSMFRWM
jgi:hypothetical protein